MNLLEHLKKLRPSDREIIGELTGIQKENVLDLYNGFAAYLEKNLSRYIGSLSLLESLIFYQAYRKPGFELESLQKKHPLELLKASLLLLKQKGLVYTTVSVQKVNPVTKVSVLPEILEIIRKKIRFYTQEELVQKIQAVRESSILCRYGEMPLEMFHFFYSYGLICRQEFAQQQFGEAALQYFLDEGLIRESLVMIEEKTDFRFYPCYELEESRIQRASFNVVRSVSYQTRIFNDIIRLIYLISREDILITRKGEINKKHYNKLAQELGSENILWFLIQFLIKHGFVEIDEEQNYIYLTARGQNFFRQDIGEVYEKIFQSDPMMEQVYQTISAISAEEFGLADVVLHTLRKEAKTSVEGFLFREKRRQVVKYLEILTYMGVLIQKFTAEGFSIYRFNPHYRNLQNEKSSSRKPIILSPSMEVSVYPQELDLQTSYILNIFMEIRSFSDVLVYALTPQSVKRALYFGFSVEELLHTLKKRSRNPVMPNVEDNLKRWAQQFQKGFLSRAILLEAPETVLDHLEHHPEYSHLIVRRLNREVAVMSPDIYHHRIIEEISVYLYT